jgi:hypothetical protein
MLAGSLDGEIDPQAERLERMKSEFLAAQQRRRDRVPAAALGPEHTDDGPTLAGPADGALSSIAAVRP